MAPRGKRAMELLEIRVGILFFFVGTVDEDGSKIKGPQDSLMTVHFILILFDYYCMFRIFIQLALYHDYFFVFTTVCHTGIERLILLTRWVRRRSHHFIGRLKVEASILPRLDVGKN